MHISGQVVKCRIALYKEAFNRQNELICNYNSTTTRHKAEKEDNVVFSLEHASIQDRKLDIEERRGE